VDLAISGLLFFRLTPITNVPYFYAVSDIVIRGSAMTGIVFVFLFFLLGSSEVQAQLPFYQGKSIRIVVGFAPGAAVDVWARVVARYWPKYIPGNPDIIV